MRNYQNVTVTCPDCGKSFKIRQFTRIDPESTPKECDRVVNRRFFQYECPNCHKSHEYPHSFSYREYKAHMTLVYASNEEEKKEYLQEYEGEDGVRIIDDMEDFIEKMLIFHEGFDDRLVEVEKNIYLNHMQKEDPEIDSVRFFYNMETVGVQGPAIAGLKGEIMTEMAQVEPFYDLVKMEAGDQLDAYEEPTLIVDGKWADDFARKVNLNLPGLDQEAEKDVQPVGNALFFNQVEELEMEDNEKEAAELIADHFDEVWDEILKGHEGKPSLMDLDEEYEDLYNAVNDFSMILMNEKKYDVCMRILKRIADTTDMSDDRLMALNMRRDYMYCIGFTKGFDEELKYLKEWMQEDPDDPYLYGTEIDVWLEKDSQKALELALKYVDTPIRRDEDEWLLDSCSNVVQETGNQELKKKLDQAVKKYNKIR